MESTYVPCDPNYRAPDETEVQLIYLDGCDNCWRVTEGGHYQYREGEASAFCSEACRREFWQKRHA